MAIRRTKKEKEVAQVRRTEQLAYVYKPDAKDKKKTVKYASTASDLLRFDSSIVKKDLLRTILASVVVFGILIALYLRF